MSWVSDYQYKWYETLAMNIVRAGGNIPRHVAFVMDGNRRYAKSQCLPKIDGHSHGFEKLANCLRWCLDMGIKEVTTFAFSIENYKRSEEEVNGLLDLAREKFQKILLEEQNLNEHGVCIRVIGNIGLLPKDLQILISKAMVLTERNDKLFLNIAFSYTSRDEITQAVETILKHGEDLKPEDISERLIEECLYTRNSSPPDLLFRTSGETRISDFLMWQISTAVLYFTNILWPQITLWNFLCGIFAYQRASLRLEPFKRHKRLQHAVQAKECNYYSERVLSYLQKLDSFRKNVLYSLSTSN
ncbi:dehydrodolichyl diphosphate synthase complex subunit DHDDS-like [Rhagoletis pomonella]|uniref:dehydrodolichyl diphosphate synthase complex subunit DHDDS-like n=1 Tax=Rhagoletis pomonella TaxID=28610 RepID=UPI00177B6516|nr:dehydrodolichyl diphosphate synthase complex subunit DHDDS-like [Rhagoletis pomonella]XP_036342884.1 dehydrodolichyl diphosphate synthase complex subunit DHDDS-like [Rhagoletis pomonella]XP_036342885.1 dehydrodolichyl diphosphate synthase complex subunit DHDDS-like [Rhagoletis pomonella]XP_036342886.1 dehydrodolichyl diphosphate synthase complex subunit DHDDS-like [Rhagoletis pomonella]XP_036342887.1 dehydrodolichyl diphosphate synthase complex subunit DHDDS-like [Rhagoletis pomonella]